MHDAARAAAEAIDYRGAGTVEFLVSTDPATGLAERFFFLEMNTRLQVEHPVTECVTGLDLVELQIQAAEGSVGSPLDRSRVDRRPGHAVEVRLYAEDPAADYQPQSGRLTRFEVPDVDVELSPADVVRRPARLRLPHRRRGRHPLRRHAGQGHRLGARPADARCGSWPACCAGRASTACVTNRDLLVEILGERAFVAEELSTDYLDATPRCTRWSRERGPAGSVVEQSLALFAAAVACTEQAVAARRVQPGIPTGWRNVTSAPQVTRFDVRGTEVEVGWHGDRDGYRFADVYGDVGEARATVGGAHRRPGGGSASTRTG